MTHSVSLSGGRTSAMMLRRLLDNPPSDLHVLFANTGKEREGTLVFLREIGSRWSVPIHWLEYVPVKGGNRVGYKEVTFDTAARAGEPFEAMMDHERYVPNSLTRICTKNLKVLVMDAFHAAHGRTPGEYVEVIGFRADEPERVARARGRAENADRILRFPLYDDGISRADVMTFWATQSFDLGLQGHESNCDLCFLKGNAIRVSILREHPELGDWWVEQERKRGHAFTKRGRKTYLDLVKLASQGVALQDDATVLPCSCHD